MGKKVKLGELIPGNLSCCSVLEMELLSIRLWFKYIMIRMLQ